MNGVNPKFEWHLAGAVWAGVVEYEGVGVSGVCFGINREQFVC